MSLRVIIATSTLAYGLNMPARRVIVTGIKRGLNDVSPIDIAQMCGRAGRTGLDEQGDAYVLLPASSFVLSKSYVENIPPITSWMDKDDVLVFHVIAEIDIGTFRDPEGFVRWHSRSLAASQGRHVRLEDAERIFTILEKCRAIERVAGGWRVTKLGRIASWLYYDPRNLFAWVTNFEDIQQRNLWHEDAALGWALGDVPIGVLDYVPQQLQRRVLDFERTVRSLGIPIKRMGLVEAWAHWASLIGADDKENGIHVYLSAVRYESERVATALELIDNQVTHWGQHEVWQALPIRLQYGVPREMLPLVAIYGIGGKRAKALWAAGFRSLADVTDKSKLPTLARVLGGPGIAKRVFNEASKLKAERR